MAGVHRVRDCCEKQGCERSSKYDTDELKAYMRRQKELRRIRELQEFEERAKILESKKKRLRELDSKCKQLAATKKSTSPQRPPQPLLTNRQNYQQHNHHQRPSPPTNHVTHLPHATKSLEKASSSSTGGQQVVMRPKVKRPKQPAEENDVRKTKSTNKLEREAADFIFREFEQIVRRECRSILKKQGLVTASDSSLSVTSEAKDFKVQRVEKPEREKITKVDKNVGTSFSLYEPRPIPPPPPRPPADTALRSSPSQNSQLSESVKPVVSSKGLYSLVDDRASNNHVEKRIRVPARRPPAVAESVKNAAASKIQAAYKGYKIRSVLCEANLRGPSVNQVDSRERVSAGSPTSDSVIQRKKMKFFKLQQASNLGYNLTSAMSLQPEKPYDHKTRLPVGVSTSLQTKSVPVKPNTDEIPGYIPPPPRGSLTPSRAPELSPRTVPLLRLKNPNEPFPKQVLDNQPTSQQNISTTSSPLKLITSISKFQLPYALQTPCSKDISSDMLRAALKQHVEQPPKSPSHVSARLSRTENKEIPRPEFRTRLGAAQAFSNLPDPAFSTVLQEKIKMLNSQQQRLMNGTSPKKSKSPTKRSQMTAVSKATEQIKKKIVEAKQILEDYKLELLRTSPGSQLSHGDDTYESDFDSESHAASQRQHSLYGHDSEILSSLGGMGVELIPRPPTLGSAKEDVEEDRSVGGESQQSSLRDLTSLKSRPSGEDGFEVQGDKESLKGVDRVPVREQVLSPPLPVPDGDQPRRSRAEAKPTEIKMSPASTPRDKLPSTAGASDFKIPSTVTLRRRETVEPIPPPQSKEEKDDRAKEPSKEPEFKKPTGAAPSKLKSFSDAAVSTEKSEEEEESDHSHATDTDYEELAPSVSKASTNVGTEDVNYETDFETDWQSLTQSKHHHSLIAQKGGVRHEYDGNTQTSLSLSLTEQYSKSAAVQIDLLSERSSKTDQGVQIQPEVVDEEIADEAPSLSAVSEKVETPSMTVQKQVEVGVDTNASISIDTNVVEEEYESDFDTEIKTASVPQKPGSVLPSVALEIVSEAKDETIAEEFSPTKDDASFANDEIRQEKKDDISSQIVEEHESVSEPSIPVEEELTKPSEELPGTQESQAIPKETQRDSQLSEDIPEDVAPSVSLKEVPSDTVQSAEKVTQSEYKEDSFENTFTSASQSQQKPEEPVPLKPLLAPVNHSSQTEDFSRISEALPESQISQEQASSESKTSQKKSVGTETPSYDEDSKPEQVRSAQKVVAAVQSQTDTLEPETKEQSTANDRGDDRGSQEIAVQAGILEQEPPTPLKNGAKFLEDVSIQSEISENLPETDCEEDEAEEEELGKAAEETEDEEAGNAEEEKDMIELAKKVDSDIIEKIESLIASEISEQFEKETEDSETTGVDSRQSNFHVEDVVYASDFENDVQSEKSEKSGDASSRKSLLAAAVKQEVGLLVTNIGNVEEKTGEGDGIPLRPLSPVADPRLKKVLNDQRTLDVLIGRIIARMFNEVSRARREAVKDARRKPESKPSHEHEDEEGSSFHGEVDGDAEWFEDDLISGGSPDDESLKREAAEIVAEQLRIENEIRALEALQAQVPATLMSLSDIPDKPPPPYSPPSSDSMSISLRAFTVQTTSKELEELIQKQVKALWPAWKQSSRLPASSTIVELTKQRNELSSNNNTETGAAEDTTKDKIESAALLSPSEVSKGAFTTLLNDLIYELIKETLLVEEEEGPLARDYVDRIRPGSLALQAQRMRIPQSEEALTSAVLSKVKNLIPYPILQNDVPVPRKRLTKWTSRPRDLVDEVLAEELIDEDREWTECWPEEILVLDRWAEKFARRALHEVNFAFKTAFSV